MTKDPREIAKVFNRAFTTGAGPKALEALKSVCYVDRSTHVPGDPYESAFREGARSVFLTITRKIEEAERPIPVPQETED